MKFLKLSPADRKFLESVIGQDKYSHEEKEAAKQILKGADTEISPTEDKDCIKLRESNQNLFRGMIKVLRLKQTPIKPITEEQESTNEMGM